MNEILGAQDRICVSEGGKGWNGSKRSLKKRTKEYSSAGSMTVFHIDSITFFLILSSLSPLPVVTVLPLSLSGTLLSPPSSTECNPV